jgi:hypothetical protein
VSRKGHRALLPETPAMSDIAQEQQVYDDEVDYEEEEDFEIEDDLLDEEIDEDDGIDGEIAEAGVSFVHVRLSSERAPG